MTTVPTTEEWRPVAGWSYEVSNLGRVRPKKWARSNPYRLPLTPSPDKNGYLTVVLMEDGRKKTRKIHQLVCEAWHGPAPPGKPEVRHLDGDNRNNDPGNLCWGTTKENAEDREKHRIARGEPGCAAKLDQATVDRLRSEYAAVMVGRGRAPNGWLQSRAEALGITKVRLCIILSGGRGYEKGR